MSILLLWWQISNRRASEVIPFPSLSSLKEVREYRVFDNYDTMDNSPAGIILYVLSVSILNCEIVRAKPFQYHKLHYCAYLSVSS